MKKPTKNDLRFIHPALHKLAVPIDGFLEHPDNPRVHSSKNLKAIGGSLKRYLQRKNVVANKTPEGNRLEAGHGVYRKMLEAGSEWIAAAIVEDDALTEIGFMLADNRAGDLSEDDPAKDAAILKLMIEAGEDVEEVGWDDKEVQALLKEPDPPKQKDDDAPIDRAAELQKVWQTERGQVWEVPSLTVPDRCHRVMCGDCRNPDDVARLLDGQKVNVAFTSPPYASQRKYDEESGFRPIKPDAYVEWFEAVQANVRAHLAPDGSWFVNIKEHCEDGQRHLYVKDLTIAHVRKWGWRFVDEFAWVHGGTPMDVERRFKNGWEPVDQYAINHDFKFNPKTVRHESESVPGKYADRKRARIPTDVSQGVTGDIFANPEHSAGLAFPSNALRLGKNSESLGHGAAFPVSLPTFFIKAYSDPGDVIFDPFLGSGTTMIAAEREGRIGYGMELSPKYLAVILERAKQANLEPRLA